MCAMFETSIYSCTSKPVLLPQESLPLITAPRVIADTPGFPPNKCIVTSVDVDGNNHQWLQTPLLWLPVAEEHWDLPSSCSVHTQLVTSMRVYGGYPQHWPPKLEPAHRWVPAWWGTPRASTAIKWVSDSPVQKWSPNNPTPMCLNFTAWDCV